MKRAGGAGSVGTTSTRAASPRRRQSAIAAQLVGDRIAERGAAQHAGPGCRGRKPRSASRRPMAVVDVDGFDHRVRAGCEARERNRARSVRRGGVERAHGGTRQAAVVENEIQFQTSPSPVGAVNPGPETRTRSLLVLAAQLAAQQELHPFLRLHLARRARALTLRAIGISTSCRSASAQAASVVRTPSATSSMPATISGSLRPRPSSIPTRRLRERSPGAGEHEVAHAGEPEEGERIGPHLHARAA